MSSDFSVPDPILVPAQASNLKQLGKYQIEKRLGVGGMGTVYLALDTDLKRRVALKVLPRDRAENPTLVRRFRSEGQASARLRHDNIVSVYESGQIDGFLFLALEYIEGQDALQRMKREGVFEPKDSLDVVIGVTHALQHAFEMNIVHRDIKPSNIMITLDGEVKLTDMGLARSIDDTLDTTITRDGTTVGTVDYMSPEQAADSKDTDIRSDLYSLGCTWFQLLTGKPPYSDGSVTNKLSAHLSAPIPDPREVNPQVPEAMVAVIHRLLAKRKEDRYQTPEELLKDLTSEALLHSADPINLLAMFGDDDQEDEPPAAPVKTVPPRSQRVRPDASRPLKKADAAPATAPSDADTIRQRPPLKRTSHSPPSKSPSAPRSGRPAGKSGKSRPHRATPQQPRSSRRISSLEESDSAAENGQAPWILFVALAAIVVIGLVLGIVFSRGNPNGPSEGVSPYSTSSVNAFHSDAINC